MGEYARLGNEEIKIGTCESMYYLRYDDRGKVRKLPNSLDAATCKNLFWRLPFPDEDHVTPGHYEDYNRGLRLYGAHSEDFPLPYADEKDDVGIMQMRNEAGLLINVPCYHGMRLPEVKAPMKVFWNGKSWFAELAHVKNTPDGVLPVVRCRFCRKMWRYEWEEILPYVHEAELKARLREYAEGREAA